LTGCATEPLIHHYPGSKALSSTRSVAEVTAIGVTVLVPLRTVNSQHGCTAPTVVVIYKLVKLLNTPAVAMHYLNPLVDDV
jgi:hypothetical protein